MKKIILVVIFLVNIGVVNAQFLQTVNKTMNRMSKKTLDTIRVKKIQDTINVELNRDGLLVTSNSVIDPEVAYLYSKRYARKINELQKKIDSIMLSNPNNLDSVNRIILGYKTKIKGYVKLKDSCDALNALNGNPRFSRKFFPLRSVPQAKEFYFKGDVHQKNIDFVSDLALQSSFDGTKSLNSNVFTGIIPFKYFPMKFGLSTTVTQSKDSIANDKATAKLPYGGLLNINLSYPLFYSSKETDSNRFFTFYMPIETKYHLDDVKDKKQFKDTYNYFEASTSLFISADLVQQSDNQDLISIFINPQISYYYGGSVFKQKIGFDNFWLSQLNCGVKVAKQFTIGANIPLYSSRKDIINKQAASIALIFEPKNKI